MTLWWHSDDTLMTLWWHSDDTLNIPWRYAQDLTKSQKHYTLLWNTLNTLRTHSEHTLNTLWTHSEHTLKALWTHSEHTLNIPWRYAQDLTKSQKTWITEWLSNMDPRDASASKNCRFDQSLDPLWKPNPQRLIPISYSAGRMWCQNTSLAFDSQQTQITL